jgi:hypothetical protein
MLWLETCRNDRSVAIPSVANLELGPNINTRSGGGVLRVSNNKTISTESGMEITPGKSVGRALSSRRWDGDANVRLTTDLQPEKHPESRISTDEGITSDRRAALSLNAPSPTRTSFESGGNGRAASFLQELKQSCSSVFTAEGMIIDSSEQHWLNARFEMVFNREPVENETVRRDKQEPKHPSPRNVTGDGILISWRFSHPQNAHGSIERSADSGRNLTK